MNKSEQLIACLEGEIAKRDEELAACRVAVENCEVFRARIVELESRYQRDVYGLNNEGDPIGGDPAGGYANDNARLRAELATIKEQEPTGWYTEDHLDDKSATTYSKELADRWVAKGWPVFPLYAAPVSEAKAQGVVMPEGWIPLTIEHEPGYPEDVAFGPKRMMDRLKKWLDRYFEMRLNATPIQQVSVPDISAMARILADRNADACNVNREDNWAIYGQDYIYDVTAMLSTAPAAPAADAGMVDMYRHLQKVTPYRFKKIQDASITDGGDVMYLHKDRFDAALLADMAAHCAAKGVV